MSQPFETVQTVTDEEAAAQRQAYVDALHRERDGYLTRGEKDRAKAVDTELARFQKAPEGRGITPTQTATPSGAAAGTNEPPASQNTTQAAKGRQRAGTTRRQGKKD
ncbi:hypothetical protein KMZ30_07310 [Phycicoccus sp. KQZ13P-1]|uniref:hypothetical protein n=1 Tax=Phycicoccus mangrovi TaxID=2840470 RepID=UPI001C0062E8|nr:hypothetical protein [Phycicoccus mangrovi]MBT9255379.1 hypothetical protein [Phycicoccus mangrovi]